MSKLGLAAAATGVGGTGAAGIYGAHLLGAFGGTVAEGDAVLKFIENKEGNHVTFEVKKKDNEDLEKDLSEDDNDIKFEKGNSFEVKVVSTTQHNTEVMEHGQSQKIEDGSNLSCTFRFEVEGNDYTNKTIKQDYKKRIFWQDTEDNGRAMMGTFGLIANTFIGYGTPPANSNKWTKEQIVEVKRKFTENCRSHKNSSDKDKPIVLKFKVEGNDLVPHSQTDVETINRWFLKDEEKDRQLHLQ